MKNRNPLAFYSSIVLLFLIVFASCKKINEATDLGSDLIPEVDNINTFADTLAVETYNELFTVQNDSLRVNRTDLHYLGHISNDPLFGKTTGSIFLELKPSSFKYSFEDHDVITIDSVVLVMNYRDLYGDSTVQQRVSVHEISQAANFKRDSFYSIYGTNFSTARQLGTKTFFPRELNDSVYAYEERAANQLRIKLDNTFGQELLSIDSTNAYFSDSAFRKYFKGFAVIPDEGFGGNAVMGFQLSDTNTKLSVYYNFEKGLKKDTSVRHFYFNSTTSANANFIKRDPTAGQINNYLTNGAGPDQYGYIQNTPGSYVRVRIPALASMNNRVIHRAELVVKQVADPSDALFTAPANLFIEALIADSDTDPNNDKYRAIPYDFTFNNDGSPDLSGLGAVANKTFDQAGRSISVWRLNLSRYVQNIVNGKETVRDFRISSPYYAWFQTPTSPSGELRPAYAQINPSSTKYRVKVGGGNNSERSQQMFLRIVYSNIQ